MELIKRYDTYGNKRYILKIKKPNMKLRIKYNTFMTLHTFFDKLKFFHKKYLFVTLTLIWMGIIFLFSHQPATISSNTSRNASLIFSNIEFFKILFTIFPIRKIAHFFLYFCLSFLIYKTFFNWEYFEKLENIYFASIFISFLYACTDEIHQIFVIGRGPNFSDVLIDTSGAIICMIFIFIFNSIKFKYLKRRL